MCCTIGPSTLLARLGHVQVQAVGADREAQAGELGDVVGPGARGVDDAMGRDRPAARGHREAVRAAVRVRLDRRSPPPASARARLARLRAARRAERRAAGSRGLRADTRPRPARSSARYGANACSSSPSEHVRLEAGLLLDLLLVDAGSAARAAVSATIRPPVMCTSIGASSSSSSVDHIAAASACSRTSVEQPVAHVVGLPRGQLVQRDLEVEAAGVRTGCLAVELAALDEYDLDALACEVVGERRRPRGRRRSRRRPCSPAAAAAQRRPLRRPVTSVTGEEAAVLDRLGQRADRHGTDGKSRSREWDRR